MPDLDDAKAAERIRQVREYFEVGSIAFDAQMEMVVPDKKIIQEAGKLMAAVGSRLADWAESESEGGV